MKWIRIVGSEFLGLFVSDWTQTAGILVILLLAFIALGPLHIAVAAFLLPVLLALHLVWTTSAEANRRRG